MVSTRAVDSKDPCYRRAADKPAKLKLVTSTAASVTKTAGICLKIYENTAHDL